MPNSRSTGRRGQGRTAALEVFSRPKQSLPVVVLAAVWRWRWELLTIAALIAAYNMLTDTGMTDAQAACTIAAVLVVVVVIPVTRRFARTRVWCVVVRHRVRACMSELRTLNYSGNLPFIVHTHGTKVGESIWLWMRPGLSVKDLEGRTEHIAAACWAREARITRSDRMAALVRVDIIRRDPLNGSNTITSPLLGDTAGVPTGNLGELPESLFDGLTTTAATTADTPVRWATVPEPVTRKSHTTTNTATAVAEPVVMVNGEDVSDYV
jgi:hypothetical protein